MATGVRRLACAFCLVNAFEYPSAAAGCGATYPCFFDNELIWI
jgi:hypothetical protein